MLFRSEEQQRVILDRFFEKVHVGDIVYHLGDLAFGPAAFQQFAQQFEDAYGSRVLFHYIEGNHDGRIRSVIRKFATTYSRILEISWENQPISLCHYIMYSCSKSHFNAWQLYGHHHAAVPTQHIGKRMNVCVDLHDFYPISIEAVQKWMEFQPNNWDMLS